MKSSQLMAILGYGKDLIDGLLGEANEVSGKGLSAAERATRSNLDLDRAFHGPPVLP